jgi:hypothetical protein
VKGDEVHVLQVELPAAAIGDLLGIDPVGIVEADETTRWVPGP